MTRPRRRYTRFLIAIVIGAAALHFVQLGSIPYGVNVDEAERAYEAYSLLHTGHDQQCGLFLKMQDRFFNW